MCLVVLCSAHQNVEDTPMTRPEVTGKAPLAASFDLEHERWLDEIVTLPEGAALRKVSVDTLRREHRRGNINILDLSVKRRGITRREALKKP
jgi:hypothetical protein